MLKRTPGTMVLFCLGVALTGWLAGSGTPLEELLKQMIEVNISDSPLPDALATASKAKGVRLVVEVPPKSPRITLKKGTRTVGEVLDEVAIQMGARRVEKGGLVVLRPEIYPTASENERSYRQAMEGVAEFLGGLKPAWRETIADEEWLDVKVLSAEKQKQVRGALLDSVPPEEIWDQWAKQFRMAVGFLFDPYIEIEGAKGQPSKRFFIRAETRFLEFDRLVSGKYPGALRAGFAGKERP